MPSSDALLESLDMGGHELESHFRFKKSGETLVAPFERDSIRLEGPCVGCYPVLYRRTIKRDCSGLLPHVFTRIEHSLTYKSRDHDVVMMTQH